MHCAQCDQGSAPLRCSQCKTSFYCSKSCQQRHWRTHKQACRPGAQSAAQDSINGGPQELHVRPVVVREKQAPRREDFEGLGWGDFEFQKSADGVEENLLVMLHGLGDSCKPFAALGKRLNLPQTSVLSLSGPIHIPETDGGRAWFTAFDENWHLIQPSPSEKRRLESLTQSRANLTQLLDNLESKRGWKRERIHLLGFSQGGTVALDLALRSCGVNRLGGVVAVSAALLPEALLQDPVPALKPCQKGCTPMLTTRGTQDDVLSRADWQRSVDFYRAQHPSADVSAKEVQKGHQMVSSKAEMRILMEFWAKTLVRTSALERSGDLVEVTGTKG